jgi:2-succinyl-5-enolpyruvyl-6-hydroxy-3-cyclohexene-1-carboxylate synthase
MAEIIAVFKLTLQINCFKNMTHTTSKIGVQILLEALLQFGIEDLVFSPGSRNAPLVIGLVGSGKFRSVCIHDERSAAFFAMGMALVSRKPVPVLCTSGSALLNYAPAIAEAYYQRIPFIAISADRPLEWIDQGDGQTIRQNGVFSNFIDYQVSFPSEAKSEAMQLEYNKAIQKALHFSFRGPVHINIPFEEPLYHKVPYEALNLPKLSRTQTAENKILDNTEHLAQTWLKHEKRMIIVGQQTPNHGLESALSFFVKDPNTIVLSENTSNLELEGIVPCIDRLLAAFSPDNEEFKPTCLMILGDAVISKKIKTFLRKSNLQLVWKVGEDFPEMKTYERLDQSFVMPSNFFLTKLVAALKTQTLQNDAKFGILWRNTYQKTAMRHTRFLEKTAHSDLKVMASILDKIPSSSVLHLGNSSVARYAQLFDVKKQLEVHCNRGTSGIDGSVSTALGAAAKQIDKMHTLVVGDVSFFYDSNALWNNYLTENARIILIHNGGGGIFEIIPGPDQSEFRDDFFVAKHHFSAEHICQAFDIEYIQASTTETVESALFHFYQDSKNRRPKLLEVFTPADENALILKKYFAAMDDLSQAI